MDINKESLNGLSDEMRAKIASCAIPEDILALAQDEGVELSDEQMESVAGGSWDCYDCSEFTCRASGAYL